MAVVFHRLIMPDGYSVDLDQFQGLDQIGEEGLKDKVNNHYLQIFGTSIALGVVAGASQITQGGGTVTTSGSQASPTMLPPVFRNLLPPSLTASYRFRQRSRFERATA
jgi:type IV secretory pathway VirB10-like protein